MADVALTGAVVGQAQVAAALSKINPLEALLLPAIAVQARTLRTGPGVSLGTAAGAICGPW